MGALWTASLLPKRECEVLQQRAQPRICARLRSRHGNGNSCSPTDKLSCRSFPRSNLGTCLTGRHRDSTKMHYQRQPTPAISHVSITTATQPLLQLDGEPLPAHSSRQRKQQNKIKIQIRASSALKTIISYTLSSPNPDSLSSPSPLYRRPGSTNATTPASRSPRATRH